jgi:chitinase
MAQRGGGLTALSLRQLIAFALCAGCAQLAPPQPRHELVGYYAGWTAPKLPPTAANIDARALTVLNYAFLDICWDGRHGHPESGGLAPCIDAGGRTTPPRDGALVLGNLELDPRNLAALRELRKVNPDLALVASVGGWTWSNRFSDMAASPQTRADFIESVVAFLRRQAFDGIDLDWEYPGEIGVPCPPAHTCQRPEDKRNFATLVREVRTALDAAGRADGKRYLATIAAGADDKFVFDSMGSAAWLVELAASLDWINLMTYDYHGSWETVSGLNAPLARDPRDPTPVDARTPVNIDATVSRYLAIGIPPRKLALGLPFYGKGWAGCPAGPRGDGLYQRCAGMARSADGSTFTFADLVHEGYLGRDTRGDHTVGGRGFVRHWNSAALVPHLYDAATGVFITYDDEASIRAKAAYLKLKGLRGAMFWELHADRHRVLGGVIARELR